MVRRRLFRHRHTDQSRFRSCCQPAQAWFGECHCIAAPKQSGMLFANQRQQYQQHQQHQHHQPLQQQQQQQQPLNAFHEQGGLNIPMLEPSMSEQGKSAGEAVEAGAAVASSAQTGVSAATTRASTARSSAALPGIASMVAFPGPTKIASPSPNGPPKTLSAPAHRPVALSQLLPTGPGLVRRVPLHSGTQAIGHVVRQSASAVSAASTTSASSAAAAAAAAAATVECIS
mmetsp:Transcript_178226/g.571303  ORF Transcript_178226/g.571303 Transcript_178226/m.571303 type:complete len:230 (+) Transcript_178226:51-740(+)